MDKDVVYANVNQHYGISFLVPSQSLGLTLSKNELNEQSFFTEEEKGIFQKVNNHKYRIIKQCTESRPCLSSTNENHSSPIILK